MFLVLDSVSEPVEDFRARRMRQIALSLLLVIAGSTQSVFSQRQSEIPSPRPFVDPKLDRIVVATVGPLKISGTEFKLNYDFGPSFAKRVKDSKKRYLNFMIYEKLLALDAEQRKLDQWADVKSQLAEIGGDLATEELYKQYVLSKVHISNRMLAQGLKEDRIQVTLQWIYCRTAREVDDLVRSMKSGLEFDTLYARQFGENVKPEDRILKSTRFKLRVRNPMFALVVDTMKAGTISLPIHGPDGWYIVRVTDEWINPIVTQTEEVQLAENVRQLLTRQISDSLSDIYLHGVISSHQPTIIRGPFNAIQAYLGNKFLSKEKFAEWELATRKGAEVLKDVSDLQPIAGLTLVELKTGTLTVADFLAWYRIREPYAKLELASPQGFFQSVEDLVWRMVRDRLLVRKAFDRGLQNRPNVIRQLRWWKEKMLYTANRNRIADTITDSLPVVRQYYDQHPRLFLDDRGNRKGFDSVKEDVWRLYYSDELTKRLLHEILRLKQRYGVKIQDSALAGITVDEQNDPKAIDVYTVKKGGIFPHLAFPSIDFDWQSWD